MKTDVQSSYIVFSFFLIILCGVSVLIVSRLRSRLIDNRSLRNLDCLSAFPNAGEGGEFRLVHIHWPVSIRTDSRVLSGAMDNITFSNAFVACQDPLPINSTLRLDIQVPDGQIIRAKGQVIWSNAAISREDIQKRGMGIRFLKLRDRDREVLRSFASDTEGPSDGQDGKNRSKES